jgi:GntR family transcriptional repressor for pyruvate dehydrogenase complex
MASIRRKKLADWVIEEIRRRILSGELKEGEKLPNQNEFAAEIGVSRTSLREALHRLTLVGAIEQRPGYGTVIKAKTAALHAEQLTPPLLEDARATVELMEARRVLELGAVKLAVQHATAEQVRQMGAHVEKMAAALTRGDTDDFMDNDLAFHFLIVKASRNRILTHQFATIRGLLDQFMREKGSVFPLLREPSLKFHREIHQALEARDRKRATTIMARHLLDIQKALERYYHSKEKDSTGRSGDERRVATG